MRIIPHRIQVVLLVHLYRLVLRVQLDESPLYPVQNVVRRPHERPLHVLLTPSRRLDVQHVEVPSQLQRLVSRHHPLLHQVYLVPDQHQHRVLLPVVPDILHPPSYVPEGVLPRGVENDKGCSGGPVVGSSDCFELLLTGGVPDLELDGFAIDNDIFGSKLDADSELVVGVENAGDEPADEAGLADASIANEDELKGVVEFGLHILIYNNNNK